MLRGLELDTGSMAPLLEAPDRRAVDVKGETRQLFEVLLALAPWIAFVIAVIWSEVYTMLEKRPSRTTDQARRTRLKS